MPGSDLNDGALKCGPPGPSQPRMVVVDEDNDCEDGYASGYLWDVFTNLHLIGRAGGGPLALSWQTRLLIHRTSNK